MNNNPIIIVGGEPFSIFSEILLKLFNYKFFKSYERPIVLIASEKLLLAHIKKFNFKFKINKIKTNNISNLKNFKNKINLINVDFKFKKPFEKISNKSSKYIEECFKISLDLMKKKRGFALINGPVSKKHLLKKKFPGITEYLAKKTGSKNEAMLIYNKHLSVCPITTHIPVKNISKSITKQKIINKIILIDNFFKKKLNKKIKFAVTGLNPHCESNYDRSEEDNIIIPAIKTLKKKKIIINGPYPADTLFIKKNLKKFDIIVGMYHDQVLAPLKTLFEFDAINITLGLPFLRISPDHGVNEEMSGKMISNPKSLKEIFIFLQKI